MSLVPKREYLLLLLGDILIFVTSLWLSLFLRYLELPSAGLWSLHLTPFLILFALWSVVFLIAGLYGKHTGLFRRKLLSTIFYAQIANVTLAGLFFFFIPFFGIAPKTILFLYLIVSSVLIILWRAGVYPRLQGIRKLKGVLIASGPDARALVEEVRRDGRYPFSFEHVIDTDHAPSHEVIQHACRVLEEDELAFLVVDTSDTAVSAALPIVYDAAFTKKRFALLDVSELYQEVFDRVPLSFVRYQWVLTNLASSALYEVVKRAFDIALALPLGLASLLVYPFVILGIKLEDGGPLFITQVRVGRYQRPIHVVKFRSMSGSDQGDDVLDSKHVVTRVGKVIRRLRVDELPQLWNVIRGDLSLVGPRPELPSLAAHYSARIPYYNARYLITPGLTGWAQILHDRHPHHGTDVAETKEKLSFDLFYLKRRSLLLDIYILFQTVRIVLTARGT